MPAPNGDTAHHQKAPKQPVKNKKHARTAAEHGTQPQTHAHAQRVQHLIQQRTDVIHKQRAYLRAI